MAKENREDRRATAGKDPDRTVHPTNPERSVYLGIGLVFALVLIGYLVYEISVVVLVILLTLLFSIIVSGPVDALERRGWRRGLGTLTVFGGAIFLFTAFGFLVAPTIGDQAEQFAGAIPSLLENTQGYLTSLQRRFGFDFSLPLDTGSIAESVRNFLSGGTLSTVANFGAGVANVVSLGAVVLIATIYAVLKPRPIVEGFVVLFPAGRRQGVRDILRAMYTAVQRWFMGQLASMLIIGTLWTIALFILGIPFALLLGILAALLSFVPYLGAAISLVPPLLIALVNDPVLAFWVVVVYLGIQTVESYLIQPMVMSRAVDLHPAVVIFAILIMGTLFGLVGVLLAVPLTAALIVLVDMVWVARMDEVGEDPDAPEPAVKGHGQLMAKLKRGLRKTVRAARHPRRS
ncbi:AI-2E family transporter [Rubrobacter indicoceani]|uniref:AI-2E family transporter n=1 Tax=Rubrobacter indicoceani TaxID=2051957 RepID=UPI0013C4582F|nr:AI-2E family transporter [Rubrobacter indicoceani]